MKIVGFQGKILEKRIEEMLEVKKFVVFGVDSPNEQFSIDFIDAFNEIEALEQIKKERRPHWTQLRWRRASHLGIGTVGRYIQLDLLLAEPGILGVAERLVLPVGGGTE